MDIEALEAAGFVKTMTVEEWEALNTETLPKVYGRPTRNAIEDLPGGVAVDYVMRRGEGRAEVFLRSERNTQNEMGAGFQTTVHYPEIAILEADEGRTRVTCAGDDTELILLLADNLAASTPRQRDRERNGNGNGRP